MAKLQRSGDVAFSKVEKINSELLTFTYGAVVTQLLNDFEDVEEVNTQLENMGYRIGLRLIDEFLAKSGVPNCRDFVETAETIAKVGFKMFLGVSAHISNWSNDKTEFSILFSETAITDFVELPNHLHGLFYSNILCGVIRGALEMVQMRVECRFVRCILHGEEQSEIVVRLLEMLTEVPAEDE